MEETGLENMTENIEKEKVLSKEAIVAALNERHSPEKQKLLSAGRVAIAGLGGLGSNVAYALALRLLSAGYLLQHESTRVSPKLRPKPELP